MQRAKVSVVIPVHNGERFVCDAIESAFAQQDAAVEVIVVDNCSRDRSAEVVAATYGDRVRLVNEPRPGAASARNLGAAFATSEYLAFLDADDVWLPGKLGRQMKELEAGADIVFCHCLEFHDPALTIAEQKEYACRPDAYPFLAPSAFLTKTVCFRRVGDLPNLAAGEFIAWYGWAQTLGMRTSVLDHVLVKRRIHATNTTRDRRLLAGYPLAAKWLIDRRRQHSIAQA